MLNKIGTFGLQTTPKGFCVATQVRRQEKSLERSFLFTLGLIIIFCTYIHEKGLESSFVPQQLIRSPLL